MPTKKAIACYTNYPFREWGDTSSFGPARLVEALAYDENKYVFIRHNNFFSTVKRFYLYSDAQCINVLTEEMIDSLPGEEEYFELIKKQN